MKNKMGRPPKPDGTVMTRRLFTITPALSARLQKAAKQTGMSQSQIVRKALLDYLNNQ